MFGVIYPNFRILRITIYADKLEVGYGVIKQNIRIEDIEKVQIHDPPWYQYGGLGLRIGWDLTYRVY